MTRKEQREKNTMSKVWQYLKQHAYGALTIVTVLLCILGSLSLIHISEPTRP